MKGSLLYLGLFLAVISLVSARSLEPKVTRSKGAGSKKIDKGSLVELYQKSMPAVMGMRSFNDTVKLLLGTYLTDKKEDSIWPRSLEETKVWFGEEYQREELEPIERGLKKYRNIITKCMEENTGKQLTSCLANLKDALITGVGDVEWHKEQEIPKSLNNFISFNLMRLASLQMLKIQQEKDAIEGINIDLSIKSVAKDFSETLKTAMGTACEQRVQRITAVETCKVVDILWQEFIQACEERIKKRSTEEDETGSGADEADEETTDDAESRSELIKQEPGEIKLSKLGGSKNDFAESLRAIVKDKVTGQYIYNKRMTVTVALNKAAVTEKLFQEGIKARNKHVAVVEQACKKYWQERGSPIAEQVAKLVDFPKKKANKKKKGKKQTKDE